MDSALEPVEFTSLLASARQQPEPQRFLFVFLDAVLPEQHTPEEAFLFSQGMGGELQPVMTLTRGLDELSTFENLVADIAEKEQDWQIVLVACVSGENGQEPTAEEVEGPLQVLEHTIRMGGDISAYTAFDRDGEQVRFG